MGKRGTPHGIDREGNDLAPLPTEEEILYELKGYGITDRWFTAEQAARYLGVAGSRRLGIRASKGNWSGGMKGGVRLAPRLLSMHRAGKLAVRLADGDRSARWEFRVPEEGEVVTVHPFAKRYVAPPRTERPSKPKKPGWTVGHA